MSSLKINGAEIENWNAGSRDGYWKAHWGLGVVFKRLLASDFFIDLWGQFYSWYEIIKNNQYK